MDFSLDQILFKDFLNNPLINQWIIENRYNYDGVLKNFLWMFTFAAFFLFTIFSSWTFLHYKGKRLGASRHLLNSISIVIGFSVFLFSNIIWNLVLIENYSIDINFFRILLTGYSYLQLTITLAMIVNNRRLVAILLYIVYASPFIIIAPVIINSLNNMNIDRHDRIMFMVYTLLIIFIFAASLQLCGWITRHDEKNNIIRFLTILILFTILNNFSRLSTPIIVTDNLKLRQILTQIMSIAAVVADLVVLLMLTLYVIDFFSVKNEAAKKHKEQEKIISLLKQEDSIIPFENLTKEEINPNNWKLKMLN